MGWVYGIKKILNSIFKITDEPIVPQPEFLAETPRMDIEVDPGSIKPCTYRFVYIWTNTDSFWAFLTHVGKYSASGYRWNGTKWVYFGISLNNIKYFLCF